MAESVTSGDTSLFGVLKLRDVRYFLTGRFASTLGNQIQFVAVGWQVYDITRDPMALGLVGLAQFLPMFLLMLPAGDLADRVDRRLLVGASYAFQAVAILLLVWLTLIESRTMWHFYLALVLIGLARAFASPALRSFIPFLVSSAQLPRTVAISSSTFQAGVIGGPALGGFIYILGPVAAYVVCFALFLLVSLCFAAIRTRHTPPPAEHGVNAFQRLTAGLAFIWTKPVVLGAISLDLFAVLLGGATALLPVYARDILHTGPEGLGMLRSAPAVGAALVTLILIFAPMQRRAGLLMFFCVGLFGVGTIVFGISEYFLLSLAALFVMGAADMISVYVRSTLIPLATPPEMLGRVSAVDMLFITASNELGEFRAGVMAGFIGTVPAVIFGGLGTLGIVGLWMWLFPSLRKIDRLSEVKAES